MLTRARPLAPVATEAIGMSQRKSGRLSLTASALHQQISTASLVEVRLSGLLSCPGSQRARPLRSAPCRGAQQVEGVGTNSLASRIKLVDVVDKFHQHNKCLQFCGSGKLRNREEKW